MSSKKILIVGKSASGKDYLIEYLKDKGLKRSVSYTTRSIREKEVEGVTYNYISESEFKNMIINNELIEYHNFNDWYYGNTFLDFKENDIFIKTIYGLKQIKKYRNGCFVIYLDIDIMTRKTRLLNRNDNNDSIDRRIEADEKDFKNFYDFDLRISEQNYDIEEIFKLISKL